MKKLTNDIIMSTIKGMMDSKKSFISTFCSAQHRTTVTKKKYIFFGKRVFSHYAYPPFDELSICLPFGMFYSYDWGSTYFYHFFVDSDYQTLSNFYSSSEIHLMINPHRMLTMSSDVCLSFSKLLSYNGVSVASASIDVTI